MPGRAIYEEAAFLAAQMAEGGERWPAWEELEPQQRANWEALAAEQARKVVEDYEQEAELAAQGYETEDDYA